MSCVCPGCDAPNCMSLKKWRVFIVQAQLLQLPQAKLGDLSQSLFRQRLRRDEIKATCRRKGLILENPTHGPDWFVLKPLIFPLQTCAACFDILRLHCVVTTWTLNNSPAPRYDPYEFLGAPYKSEVSHLYESFSEGQKVKIMTNLCMGNKHVEGPGKGCDFNLVELNSVDKGNKTSLAFFPLHNQTQLHALYQAWMPIDWPWNLPINDIAEYFGEVR